MRIITNDAHIKTRTFLGERAPFVGLVLLGLATALIFLRPEWLWISMVFVWVGFIVSLTGSYLGERYVGPLAHHKKVPEALKGLDNRYTLLMYQTPLPFVLVDPGGVTVITVKSQGGVISYSDGKWRHRERMGLLRRLAGQESLGRPHRLIQAEIEEMRQHLTRLLPEDVEIPVRGVLLLINPNVQVEADEPPVPVLRLSQLKRWLRKEGRWPKLSEEVAEQLNSALEIA